MKEEVILTTKLIGDLLAIGLKIPDYQRIYCWKEKHVYQLWEDILSLKKDKIYHLGSIILHKKGDCYDVVDGQQRLITLALIMKELGQADDANPLLKECLFSEEAEKYVAYNKYLIGNYASALSSKEKEERLDVLLNSLQFAVLELSSDTLDLAYTFFSNQNSKGKPLTDYNLLKAHHLRFVHVEEQAKHLATRWDGLTNTNTQDDKREENLERTLGIYLFRLRKWMRKRNWNESAKYRVKNEFEAARTITEIPPFGEKFFFYETIQGGTHFFAFTEHFVHQFKTFQNTTQWKSLSDNLCWESHWNYGDCIETLLFAYFLKFGTMYLTEALICIEKVISQHRYKVNRAMLYKVLEFTGQTEIAMMIDQATSPTFFLAEIADKIKRSPKLERNSPIKERYFARAVSMYNQIGLNDISINEIKEFIDGKK